MKARINKVLLATLLSSWSITTLAQSDGKLLCLIFPHLCESESPSITPTISVQPSVRPTSSESPTQTNLPTILPSRLPSSIPSHSPTMTPTFTPSLSPTDIPSLKPSLSPTSRPSLKPSLSPTDSPTLVPSTIPSSTPSSKPTNMPSLKPSSTPTERPTLTNNPSTIPTTSPSSTPTLSMPPSDMPTTSSIPSSAPTSYPSIQPTVIPSSIPSSTPSAPPTSTPSSAPTSSPSNSSSPTMTPSSSPSFMPSGAPTSTPTTQPSIEPTSTPTTQPSVEPTLQPSTYPSRSPTIEPSVIPSVAPSSSPSNVHSNNPSQVPSLEPRPNLIMILTDEHNLRTLGCYRDLLEGEQAHVWGEGVVVETPNLDRLAAEGALFSNFYTITPLCTPSRASFMTGLSPSKTGGSSINHGRMDDNMITFAEVLKEQRDYYTGYIGKWHLDGEDKPGWSDGSRNFGFMNTTIQYNRGHWKYFDMVDGNMAAYENNDEGLFDGREDKHFATDYLFDRAIEFMDIAKSRNDPFAYVLSIPDPHAPNVVRPPYEDMYKNMYFNIPRTGKMTARKNPASPLWNFNDFSDVPLKDVNKYLRDFESSKKYQRHLNQYFGMVKCIDDNVGKLLDYLDKEGIDQETIVVFTSDHGDLLAEHGKYNKGRPYRTAAGIPFILRYPEKVNQGTVIHSAMSSIDFAPSILSLMGIENHGVSFDGVDFTGELTSGFVETNHNSKKYIYDPADGKWAAVVMGEFKLVVSSNDVPWLFNLSEDPFEVINYFDNPKYTDIQTSLLADLFEAIDKYDMPNRNSTRFMFWGKPACWDSKDRIIIDSEKYTCKDIGELLPYEKCSDSALQQHCPVTCGVCCEDAKDDLWIDGSLLTCAQLKWNCGKNKVQMFCPETCNSCSASNVTYVF